MDNDQWLILVAGLNILLAFVYLNLGLFFIPKIDAAAPAWALWLFRVVGVIFFVNRAVGRGLSAYYIWNGTIPVTYWLTAYYVGELTIQLVTTGTLMVLSFSLVHMRIFDRRFTQEMIDRMVDEAADIAAHDGRLRSVEGVVADATRAREMAELILSAIKEPRHVCK